MEENDTKEPTAYLAYDQTPQQENLVEPSMSDYTEREHYVQQYAQRLIDPFGLLRKVIATATIPKIIAELSFYVMIILTALWDVVIVMAITTTVFKLLVVIIYCIKKTSRCLCFICSGKNKRALRRVIWNAQQTKKPYQTTDEVLNGTEMLNQTPK